MKPADVYRRYEAARQKKGLRNSDVSRMTGISPSVLSDWKLGKYQLKYDKMLLISKAVGVPVGKLYAD